MGSGDGRRYGKAEVVEDRPGCFSFRQHCQDAERAAAGVAYKHVQHEDAFHQRRPVEPPPWLAGGSVRGTPGGARRVRGDETRHGGPVAVVRGKHAVVDQVSPAPVRSASLNS